MRRPRLWVATLGLGLLGLVIAGQFQSFADPLRERFGNYLPFMKNKERRLDTLITDTVKRGPFRITVTERGTLDSLRNVVLASRVEGSTTIIGIVPEGSYVQVGDLVCELDASALIEKEQQQQIQVTQSDSAMQSAKEAVEIQKTQNDSDIAAAQLQLELAKLDLEKFEMGDLEQQMAELKSHVTLSEEKLAQADEVYEFTSRLVKKGYKTQSELESARITQQTEKINLQIALGKLQLLDKYDKKRTLTELRANATEYERELDRVRRKAAAALTQAEADLASKRLTYDVELSKHLRLKEQIARCKIYATQDGQVIYANSRDGRGSDQVLIEEGSTVRERQPIVNLPDLSEMKVNARIHESRISMIRPGLSVTVKVDAFGGRTFPGRVETVASVPSSTGSFMTRDLKEYEAVVRILGDPSNISQLRPGLTAELEVLVSSRDNVLQTPMQSVVTVVGRQVAFVIKNGRIDQRFVKIGQSNDRTLEVLEGLEDGERVVMNPKSSFAKELALIEAELIAERRASGESEEVPDELPTVLPITPPGSAEPSGERRGGGRPEGAGRPDGIGRPEGGRPVGESVPAGERGGPGADNDRQPAGSEQRSSKSLAFFERMDLDQDGVLSDSELVGNLAGKLSELDANGDGVISRDEYSTYMENNRARGGPENRGPREQVGGG